MSTFEKIGYALMGVGVVGIVITMIMRLPIDTVTPLTCGEVRQQHNVYRMCMQTADSTGCTMQVEDFAAYLELERQLEGCSNDN